MKYSILIIQYLIISASLFAQRVPSFSGETTGNKTVNIPTDTKGNYTFICFATSTKAQQDLEGWLEPVYNKFIAKTGLMDEFYNVNVFFIPVFRGADAAMIETMKRRFNTTAQEDIKEHVLFCKGELPEVTAALNIRDDHIPYFFLLDTAGNIVYRTSGVFSEEKFDALDDMIE